MHKSIHNIIPLLLHKILLYCISPPYQDVITDIFDYNKKVALKKLPSTKTWKLFYPSMLQNVTSVPTGTLPKFVSFAIFAHQVKLSY